MRAFKIIIIILVLFACNNSKNEVIKKIAGNTGKYWDVKRDKDIDHSPPLYCYYFDNNGKYRIFEYSNNKRVLYDGGDIEIPEVWSYLTDSTIMIATANYKIEKLTSDTFIYSSPELGQKMLIKSKEQSTALDTIIEK